MDHIAYPSHPVLLPAPITVPFLCCHDEVYDGLEFEGFAKRKGWTSDKRSAAWLDCEDEEAGRRAQLWLYFGTISALIGEAIDKDVFLEQNRQTSTPYLSSRGLLPLLQRHQQAFVGKHLGSATKIIKEAALQHAFVEQRVSDGSSSLPLVSCAISILLQTLGSAILQQDAASWRMPAPKAIRHRMRASGWCPYMITLLGRKYSCTALYYISGNSVATGGFQHDECTGMSCQMQNLKEEAYQPLHTKNRCECGLVGPPSKDVASRIEAGGIPLVACWLSSGQVCFELVTAEPQTRYVAVSHVWSGGLGNPRANTIATCQLRRLFEICGQTLHEAQALNFLTDHTGGREKQGTVHFWLDTMCIPVGDDTQDAKKISIARMSQIYSQATRVLVLDVDLQKLPCKDVEPEQILSRIVCSSWMYRCWTLQEASLSRARNCCFQFSDTAITSDAISREAKRRLLHLDIRDSRSHKCWSVKELDQVLQNLEDVGWGRPFRGTMWNHQQQAMLQADAFAATWNNFLGRSSTNEGDVYRIFAAMQDFKAGPFRQVRAEHRMKAILKGHAVLPLDLLFSGAGKTANSGDLQSGRDTASSWVPSLPSGRPVDCQVGYLRLYTDCFVVQSSAITSLLVSLDASTITTFSVWVKSGAHTEEVFIDRDASDAGRSEHAAQEQESKHASLHCVLFPNDAASLRNAAVWYDRGGALFEVVSHETKTLHLIYRHAVKVRAYHAGLRSQSPAIALEGQTVSSHCQILIDCDTSSWPTTPHFFHSLESAFFQEASNSLYWTAYAYIQFSWTLSVVISMTKAPTFQLERLPILYTYMAKMVLLTIPELLWYSHMWETMKRLNWSNDFGVGSKTVAVPSCYETINSRPSLLWGPRRAGMLALTAVVFMAIGFKAPGDDVRWARWTGTMLLIDLVLRTAAYALWTKGPQTKRGRRLGNLISHHWWPALRATPLREWPWYFPARVKEERTPYSEDTSIAVTAFVPWVVPGAVFLKAVAFGHSTAWEDLRALPACRLWLEVVFGMLLLIPSTLFLAMGVFVVIPAWP